MIPKTNKAKKIRIVVVSHDCFWPPMGGGSNRVHWVVKEILDRGHEVIIIAPMLSDDGLLKEFPHLEIINLGKISRLSKSKELIYLKLMWRIFRRLCKIKPDLIYARSVVAGFPSLLIAKLKRIPMVLDMGDLITGLSKNKLVAKFGPFMEYFIARQATKTISMSQSLAQVLKNHGTKNISWVSNGVNLSLFRPNYQIEKENLVIYQGGIERHDGARLIPVAAKDVINELPKTKFMIIGDGKDLPLVKELVRKFNLEGNFIFKGWVNQTEIPRYLTRSRIGLVTHLKSLACEVALVLKGLEYMATELPVVAPDLQGMKEEVGQNERGLIFKCGDAKDLSAKIIYLLKHPQLQEQLGQAGRKFVQKNCDWSKIAERIVDICENCLREYHDQ